MGNMMRKNQDGQVAAQQGGMYPPYQQQPPIIQQQPVPQQPQFVQQPQYAPQQPQYAPQQPQYAPQQPQYAPQQPFMPQQPQYAPQQPPPYRPHMFPQQQGSFRPSHPGGSFMPHLSTPPQLSLPNSHNPSYYENDAFLSNLTGWSTEDIERLRHEFLTYTNSYGVIDRDGFRKLYVASLLNMTWEAVEHDAEAAFRNFDINQTGVLDFNEYITACARLTREVQAPYSPPPYSSAPPPMSPSYIY